MKLNILFLPAKKNLKIIVLAFVKRKMYHPTNRIVYHLAKKEGEEVISLGS
jgi:hypothetical protein